MSALIVLCVACRDDTSSQEQLRRLVGDGTLGPAQVGPSEEIEIRVHHWLPTFERRLAFTLTPDDTLAVRRFRIAFDARRFPEEIQEIERSDQVRLSPEAAAEFRRRLAVFRPATLARDGPFLLPKGCNYIFDADARMSVAFGAPDLRFGVFVHQSECRNSNAERLDEALREVLATLPRTRAAAGFVW